MNCEELSNHVVDYLDGALGADLSTELETHVEGCDSCREQVRVLRRTWMGLEELPQEEPSPRLRERFYAMLDDERGAAAVPRPASGLGAWFEGFGIRPMVPQAIAAGLVFVGGILIGAQMGGGSSAPDASVVDLRAEVRSLSHLVTISLLQQDSASERLRGVRYGSVAVVHDDEVLTALIDAVGHDDSVNVRLAAIDALLPHVSRRTVRNSMITFLRRERSPVVQVSLVDALMEANGRETRENLEAFANDETVDETVRTHVWTALEKST